MVAVALAPEMRSVQHRGGVEEGAEIDRAEEAIRPIFGGVSVTAVEATALGRLPYARSRNWRTAAVTIAVAVAELRARDDARPRIRRVRGRWNSGWGLEVVAGGGKVREENQLARGPVEEAHARWKLTVQRWSHTSRQRTLAVQLPAPSV